MNPAVAPLAQLFASMAAAVPGAQPATPCSALATVPFDGAELLSSVAVEAHDGLPAHCRVRGVAVPAWLSGAPGTGNPALVTLFARDFLRYMAFTHDPGEGYDTPDYDFDRDPARLAHMAALYDAEPTDLDEFRRRGGKLILYHGWADPIVTPLRTVEYFEAVQNANGGAHSTAEFARLFMLPGFGHCGLQDGPGPNDAGFDPLPALEAWVEQGIAPDSIPAHRRDAAGAVQWSRPVCAYPQIARVRPGGNPHRADDFECRMPES